MDYLNIYRDVRLFAADFRRGNLTRTSARQTNMTWTDLAKLTEALSHLAVIRAFAIA